MTKMALGIILIFISQWGTAADLSFVKKEIQNLKPTLKNSEVTFVQLKSGEILAAAELTTDDEDSEESSLNVDFYLKDKNAKAWTFLDHLDLENDSFEFRRDGVLKISLSESGTSHSETTLLWRLENGKMRLIGKDSVLYDSWALNTNSKETPVKQTISTNFLTGKTNFIAEFANGKVNKHQCQFDPALFKNQKISDVSSSGINEPSCPGKTHTSKKINGK